MFALGGGIAASSAVANAAAVGVNVAATSGDFFHSEKVIAALRESRPAWIRVFLGWNGLETAQGSYNTAEIAAYAHFFSRLPAGTKIDVDVSGSPAWANGGSQSISTPPVDNAAYAGFLNHLVNAFHGRVTAWEIWNEEDNSGWWSGTPAQYVGLLKAAYPAVKSADPNATVIVGGLTGNDGAYLQQLYAAGAEGSFDVVGVHTDTACNIASPNKYEFNLGTHTVNQYFFLGFISIHAAMAAAGDAAKPIYMTELGWSATNAECETGHWAGQKLAGVSPQTQATYLKQAYHCLAQPQYRYVKAAMWFELFNNATDSAPLDNFGLLDHNYVANPAFGAFTQESLHGDKLSGPCGDFAPPAIKILRPTSGAVYSGPLHIAIRASDAAGGVREITIKLSHTARVHFFSKHFAKTFSSHVTWLAAKTLKPGPHRIKVIVTDKLGNVSRRTIVVVHAATKSRHSGPLHG
jgi:Cellulase (glycosyl hydrolase family 5)